MISAVSLVLICVSAVVGTHGYTNRPAIFVHGQFLTMDSDDTVVTALGVQSGYIQAVGNQEDVKARMSQLQSQLSWHIRLFGMRHIDLNGHSVLPGFVDAHSHFPASGIVRVGLDISSPPFGVVEDIPTLLRLIAAKAKIQPKRRWIIGFNYDDAGLNEKRHPTRAELDQVAPDHAVYLRHRSGHMGVANTRALAQLGHEPQVLTSLNALDSKPRPSQQQLPAINGLLQEKSAPSMSRLLQEVPWWNFPDILFKARDEYLQAGVTTLQNGLADKNILQVLRYAAKLGLLPQRIIVWPANDKLNSEPDPSLLTDEQASSASSGERLAHAITWPMDDHRDVVVGAIKLVADGSPQGRTALMLEPYLKDTWPGDHYHGIANLPKATLHELIVKYHKAGFQLALHGNGDAAIQSIIEGLQVAITQYPRNDARHFIVHAQTIRADQLQTLSRLDVSVSFFAAHTFYWGDWYRERVLGEKRAAFISPLASADTLGVRYSIHADTPVTPMNPMQMLWSATERLTSSGFLLGAEQRVSRLRALRALTIDAAWQNHIDDDRGSLEAGKLADFIALSDNPLEHQDVRDITVRQVWIGGKRKFFKEP